MSAPITFAQISDTHIYADPNSALLGVKTRQSFDAVIDLLKQEKSLAFIIHTGDVSQDGTIESYQYAAERLSELKIPVYYTAGNHDHPAIMQQVFPCERLLADKHILMQNWQLILLNSQVPGKVEGRLSEEELNRLTNYLTDLNNKHAVVLFHHQPYDIGCNWLKPIGLTNHDVLFERIAPFPKLKHIIFGHVHQASEKKIQGIQTFSAPSTCIQFKPNHHEFKLDNTPPGYCIYQLFDDGRIEMTVKRVAHYVGIFDANATGY